MSPLPWSIGLMSGTSMDGIDAALLRTDGRQVGEFGAALTIPYSEGLRSEIRAALGGHPGGGLANALTRAHAGAVKAVLAAAGLAADEIALVGFHGHTLVHRPSAGRTWQLGDGGLLARLVGIATVSDFRSQDVAMGGQGAPLVPLYHAALALRDGLPLPLLVLNIGGVANVTYVGGADDADLLAFDTGPGNALLDDWMLRHTGAPIDAGGETAARGAVDSGILARLLEHPYFASRPPKSLDRDDFSADAVAGLTLEAGAATLVSFTVAAVVKALDHLPRAPALCLVSGGGRHNAALMAGLRSALPMPVRPVESAGWRGDFIEAEAFAYLAARAAAGLSLSVPGTTGVRAPLSGGRLWQPPGFQG